MNGLHDYILWLGEFDFTAVPFREADAVILCLLTYCDFTPLFEHSDEALLRDCQGLIDAGEVHIQRIGKAEPFIQILEAAANSRRFGTLRMTGYVDIMLPRGPIQFSAITYHSDAGWSFIAYRGTDSSLAGWKEDFMISFKRTEAQELALQYAEDRINSELDMRDLNDSTALLALNSFELLETQVDEIRRFLGEDRAYPHRAVLRLRLPPARPRHLGNRSREAGAAAADCSPQRHHQRDTRQVDRRFGM